MSKRIQCWPSVDKYSLNYLTGGYVFRNYRHGTVLLGNKMSQKLYHSYIYNHLTYIRTDVQIVDIVFISYITVKYTLRNTIDMILYKKYTMSME